MKSLPPWRAQGEVMAHLSVVVVVVVVVVWGVWVGDEEPTSLVSTGESDEPTSLVSTKGGDEEPTSLVSTGGRECRRAYLLGEHRGEGVQKSLPRW